MDNGVMKMREMKDGLEIPAHGSVKLSPSGYHLMFTGLKHPLVKGQTVKTTLNFEHAGSVTVDFPVSGIGAPAPPPAEGHEHEGDEDVTPPAVAADRWRPPLALCRFAHFVAAMALFGATAFVVRACARRDLALALAPAVRRIAAIAIPIAAVSALVWLALEAASMTESGAALSTPARSQSVLTDTAFGEVWQGRLLLALALVVAVALRRHGPSTAAPDAG